MTTFAWPLFLIKDANNMCATSIAIVFLCFISIWREREKEGKLSTCGDLYLWATLEMCVFLLHCMNNFNGIFLDIAHDEVT